MKAIVLEENGGIEQLTLKNVDTPTISENEVLIEVKAIGINPVDAFVRKNSQALNFILKPHPGEKTFILGWDVSGVVKEVGDKVVEFKKGDDVFGLINFYGQGKAYAEYVVAPAHQLAMKPKIVSHEEAAAASLAALTAWQALVTYANIKKGDKVVIHAAGGGVGHYAVQIAKYFGAHVIGTASTSKKDFVLSLGADEVIDYAKEKFEDRIKDADIVLDSIFGDHVLRSLDAVKKGGSVITLLTHFDGKIAEKAQEKEVIGYRHSVSSNGGDMKQIAKLLAERNLRSHVSHRYSFSDLPQAHAQIETGKTVGKIVVTV